MATEVAERQALDPANGFESEQPFVLRGLVADWPAVKAGAQSSLAMVDYLRSHDRGASVIVWRGAPEIGGRFFYNHDMSGFNFRAEHCRFDQVLDRLVETTDEAVCESLYVGSTTVDTCLPGFAENNSLDLGKRDPLASIWIGNRTRIAAHHDLPDNLACVVAGRRRFTLFPPEQLGNLYIGPLDFTPAGQAISMVDMAAPDYQRFPRFAAAMEAAQVVELNAGDALFIPSLWWHQVESLDSLNVLVNYWWRDTPSFMDSPMNALMLSLMTLRDLPPAQRRAWANMFRHYVFEADQTTAAHIPEQARGVLATIQADTARALRAKLLRNLNR